MTPRKLLLTLAAILGLGVAGAVPAIAQESGSTDSTAGDCQAGFLITSEEEVSGLEDEEDNDDGDEGLLGLGLFSSDDDNGDDGDEGLLGLGLFSSEDDNGDDQQTQQVGDDSRAKSRVCVDALPENESDNDNNNNNNNNDDDEDDGLLGLGSLLGDEDEGDRSDG